MKSGLFVGLTTADLVFEVDQIPVQNQKIRARSCSTLPGGPAFNAATTFAQLGGQTEVQTVIGDSPFREMVEGVGRCFAIQLTDLTTESDLSLPVATVLLTPDGDRTVISQARADTTKVLHQAPSTLDAHIILIDGHYPEAARRIIREAKSQSIPVVMDGGSWKSHTPDLLPFVDILICSADFSLPRELGDDLWGYCQGAGVTHLAVTHGADPVEYWSEGQTLSIPVPKVDIVDTLGAGDVFHGAFCWYFLETGDVSDSLRLAGKVASESCRYRGLGWME